MSDNNEVGKKPSKLAVAAGWIGLVTAVTGFLMIGGLDSWTMPFIKGYGGNQNPLVGIPNSAMFLVGLGGHLIQYAVGKGLLAISAISIAIWVITDNNKTKNYVALSLAAIVLGVAWYGNGSSSSKKTAPTHLQAGWYIRDPWMGICGDRYTRTGLDVFSYPNKKKVFEGHSVAGVSQGLQTGWYENGQKRFEVNCVNGENEGLQVGWHENGQKRFEKNFVNGGYVSSTEWYENGQKSSESSRSGDEYVGTVTETGWYQNGQMASETTYDLEQSEKLVTVWHDNGQLKSRVSYKDDLPQQDIVTTWHANGEKASEVHYDGITDDPNFAPSAIKSGLETSWYLNGQKHYEKSYVKGIQVQDTSWYPNGQLWHEGSQHNNRGNGTAKMWYKNGQLESQMTYSDGVQVGVMTTWYENGQKRFQEEGISRETPNGRVRQRWDSSGTLTERVQFDEKGQTEKTEYWDSDGKPKADPYGR